MSLKPEVSVGMGLATATVVFAIYNQALPSQADVRSLDSHNGDIATSEKMAAWAAAGAVAGISLLTQDATVFVIGGTMVLALSWWHRYSNAVNPLTGRAVTGITNISGMTPTIAQTEAPELYAAPAAPAYAMAF